MTDRQATETTEGERIRLTPDSLYPLGVAFGLLVTLVSAFMWWPVMVIGILWMFVAGVKWLRQSRADTAALPIRR